MPLVSKLLVEETGIPGEKIMENSFDKK